MPFSARGIYFESFQSLIGEGHNILLEQLWDSPKALLATLAQKASKKHLLILTAASQEENRLVDDFHFFADCEVLDYPAWETLPSEDVAPSPDIVGDRYKVLSRLRNNSTPTIIVTGLQACLQLLIPPQDFDTLNMTIAPGQVLNFDSFQERLIKMGYQKRKVAADKGEFAVRGGIIDLFPISSPDPFRIEFWDDEVSSIRIYDPVGQKSIRQVSKIEMLPAQEKELLSGEKPLATIFDYLGEDLLIIFDDLAALEDRYVSLLSIPGICSKTFCTIQHLLGQMEKKQKIYISRQPIESLTQVKGIQKRSYPNFDGVGEAVTFEMFQKDLRATRWHHPFIPLTDYLRPDDCLTEEHLDGNEILRGLGENVEEDVEVFLCCTTDSEEQLFRSKLSEQNISLPLRTEFFRGYLSKGFFQRDEKILILPLTEITKRYAIRRQKQRSTYHTPASEICELTPGNHVVHLHHGIGKYLGTDRKTNHLGIETEFFVIEYAEKSKLFVPLSQAHLVSRYIGTTEAAAKLHTIGGTRWKRTKELTEKAIMGYAAELLDVYAKRSLHGGYACLPDSEEMQQFETDFSYIETEDQLQAIASIKKDMTSEKSMDRLVCGDVGYGKTEVAIRAAFKAVLDGKKQVAVLVPTTILATQHYENFTARMASWPVTVEVLSRFRSAKETHAVLDGVAKGSVDILIGTHRIVSHDVQFKDLGLVIIDEEQRFGVKAKEHLKKIKTGVDCLILSATPIPRTLYMSLIGARDMSVIATPPQDRLPIKTIIAESDHETWRTALLRELNRDGQAYVIHNRVESIHEVANTVRKLIPQARVVVAHGQMDAEDVDQVFHAFKEGQADILVATTIVENGIDIPNANTILIDRADTFGLADLYQLRGRVGRWVRRAYAYFLVPKKKALPEITLKRLNALVESSGYGGGMKIAMRDLEIRGAGDMLGTEQSGHVSAIGFHLYCKLLKRTIEALRGELPNALCDPKLEFPQDARLPPYYIFEESLRMDLYQRLGETIRYEEVDAILEEIRDRFGPPPEPVLWLYHITRLRVFASRNHITLIKMENRSLSWEMKRGKQTVHRQVLLAPPKNPADLETKVLKAINP